MCRRSPKTGTSVWPQLLRTVWENKPIMNTKCDQFNVRGLRSVISCDATIWRRVYPTERHDTSTLCSGGMGFVSRPDVLRSFRVLFSPSMYITGQKRPQSSYQVLPTQSVLKWTFQRSKFSQRSVCNFKMYRACRRLFKDRRCQVLYHVGMVTASRSLRHQV